MRGPRTSTTGIWPRAASRTFAVVCLAVLPGCAFLDRSGIVTYLTYDAVAIVRNGAGAEVAIAGPEDALFDGTGLVLAVGGGPGTPEEQARSLFLRAINRRLMAGGDEMFEARFGPGPWCLAAEPSVFPRRERVETATPEETVPELPMCTGAPPPPPCNAAGADPLLGVDPPTFAFGAVPLGAPAGATIPVTLFNDGTGYICLASVVTSGRDALDYRVDDSDCRPASPEQARALLGAGARPSCTLLVTFDPTRPGPREATLRISSNDPQVLREFPLTGIGQAGALAPTTPLCVPRASDGCFRRTLTLTNTGPGEVSVRSLSLDGPDWTGTCTPSAPTVVPNGGTIACPHESCLSAPGEGRLVIQSDGVGADPTATVVEIPIVAQVTPATCTP